MDFEIGHRFAVPAEDVAAAMLDEDYQRSLTNLPSLRSRELLSQDRRGDGTVIRRVRCVLGAELPAGARNFLGGAEPAWVEEATWDAGALRWDWVIVPEVAGHLLSSRGSIELMAEGDSCARWVRGRVSVRVPVVAGRVERVIVDGIRRAYDEEAQRLGGWLTR